MNLLRLTRRICIAVVLSAHLAPAQVRHEPYEWGNVAILGGGFVSGIITHPARPGLIYARTDIGGAYRWDDSNRRWIALNDWCTQETWNYTGIESLAVDPSDPDRVYIAAGTYTNNWAGLGAIFRSSNQGATWEKTDLPFKNGGNEEGRNAGERLQVDPNDGRILFFGTRNEGLWTSTDRGTTWKRVESFPVKSRTNGVGLVFVAFDKSSTSRGQATPVIFVGVSGATPNLYRSADGGTTWTAVEGAPADLLPNHGIVSRDGSALYVTYANAPGPNGMTSGAVWKYDTRQNVWTDITPIKPSRSDAFGYSGVSIDARNPRALIVSTMDRWAHRDTIFRSTDGGANWISLLEQATFDHSNAPYTKRLTPHWTGDVEINPHDSNHILFVTGYGVWACRNLADADQGKPTHWTFDNEGLEECVINDLISPPGEALLLSAMWDLDGFRHVALETSPPAGNYHPHFGRCTSLDFAEKNPDLIVRVYGGSNTHGSYSTDNGVTWTAFQSAPRGDGDGVVAVACDGSTIVWAQRRGGVVRSDDLGKTWTAAAGIESGVSLAADREDSQRFYAFDPRSGKLSISRDGGLNFTPIDQTFPGGGGMVRAVPGHAGHLWLTTGGGVYRSTDGAASFILAGKFEPAYKIGFGKAAEGQIHPAVFVNGKVDGSYGIYRSDDAGDTWIRINDDQHQFAVINAITGDPRVFGQVYLGSASRGVIYGRPSSRGR